MTRVDQLDRELSLALEAYRRAQSHPERIELMLWVSRRAADLATALEHYPADCI